MVLKKIFQFGHHDLKKGVPLVLLAWVCFSTLYMLSKLLVDHTTTSTMLFFRNILPLLCVIPWVIIKWSKSLQVKNFKIILIRSLTGLLNLLFIILAVQRISIVNTTLLNNSAPFFIPIIIAIWLKKPINHLLWPAILVGFIGIALILEPDRHIFNMGALYGLASGICLALTTITMRLTTRSENLYTYLFYFFLIGLVVTTPFAIIDWRVDTFWTLLGLLSIGLLSGAGQILLFHGMKYGKAQELGPLSYSAVIFSGIYEWLIWGQIPKPMAYVGIILIAAAGIWIIRFSKPPVKKID